MEIKNKWKVILALFAAALFIFEIFALGLLGSGSGGGGSTGEILAGTAEFKGTIRTYDPMLALPLDTDEEVLSELREMEGVQSVIPNSDSIVVNTETRDDVYPIGEFLGENNITGYAIANIAMPSVLEVRLGNGSIENVTAGSFAVRIVTEPIVDVDTEVTITMVVGVLDGIIVNYGSPLIASEEEEIIVDARIVEVDFIHTYLIPWEERSEIDFENVTDYEAVYLQKDSVLLSQPLTMEEIMEKKNISYVEYIDQYSIECSEDFNNVTQIINDFGENITLPDSILTISSNETVNLNYSGSVVYYYTLSLPEEADGITIGKEEAELELPGSYEVNSTVKIKVTGTVIGEKMVAVKSVEPA